MAYSVFLGLSNGDVVATNTESYSTPIELTDLTSPTEAAVTSDISSRGYLAVGWVAHNKALAVYDETRQPVTGVPNLAYVYAVRWSPDGQFLAVGLNGSPYLRIFDVDTWQPLPVTSPISTHISSLSWVGSRLAVASRQSSHCVLLNTQTWGVAATINCLHNIRGVALAPGAERLAASTISAGWLARVFRVSDGALLANYFSRPGGSNDTVPTDGPVAWSKTGRYLAVAVGTHGGGVIDTNDHTTALALASARCVKFTPEDEAVIFASHFSPYVATGYHGANWAPIASTPALPDRVRSISIDGVNAAVIQHGLLFDFGGTPVQGTIRVFFRDSLTLMTSVASDPNTGAWSANMLASGHYLLVAQDPRAGIQGPADMLLPLYIDETALDRPPVRLYIPTAAPSVVIGNTATRGSDGGPVDAVVIRHWESRRIITIVAPDATGAWSAAVPPGRYDISYLSDGCLPVCHGPYQVLAPS